MVSKQASEPGEALDLVCFFPLGVIAFPYRRQAERGRPYCPGLAAGVFLPEEIQYGLRGVCATPSNPNAALIPSPWIAGQDRTIKSQLGASTDCRPTPWLLLCFRAPHAASPRWLPYDAPMGRVTRRGKRKQCRCPVLC